MLCLWESRIAQMANTLIALYYPTKAYGIVLVLHEINHRL